MQSYLAKVQVASGQIVAGTILDSMIKDRWIRRETCDRGLITVLPELAAIQQVLCNIIQPQALTEIAQVLSWFHGAMPDQRYNASLILAFASKQPLLTVHMVRCLGGFLRR